jgi:surfeit locus 1 family protein
MSRAGIAAKIPYPLAPYYLVLTGGDSAGAHPARRELPALDDGPHLGYAMQWFAFATIALVGAGAVVRRDRRSGARRA